MREAAAAASQRTVRARPYVRIHGTMFAPHRRRRRPLGVSATHLVPLYGRFDLQHAERPGRYARHVSPLLPSTSTAKTCLFESAEEEEETGKVLGNMAIPGNVAGV